MSGAAIKEGDIVRNFSNVDKLIIPTSGGEDSLWVPKSSVKLTSFRASENGEYDISDAYGWSRVSVSVRTRREYVSGLRNGNEVIIRCDDNGYLTEETIPESIEITHVPDKTDYTVGEEIDIDGLVVTAKNADGTTWTSADYPSGVIPADELSISPTEAEIGEYKITTGPLGDSPVWAAGTRYLNHAYQQKSTGVYWTIEQTFNLNDVGSDQYRMFSIYRDDIDWFYSFASLMPPYNGTASDFVEHDITKRNGVVKTDTTYVLDKWSLYPYSIYDSELGVWRPGRSNRLFSDYLDPEGSTEINYTIDTDIPINTDVDMSSNSTVGRLIWADLNDGIVKSVCPITVTWHRPQDGAALTATFNVRVTTD